MAKIVILFTLILFIFCGCMTPVFLVKKDTVVDPGSIYIIGRIQSEFELIQNGGFKSGKEAVCSIIMNKEPDSSPVFTMGTDRSYLTTPTDDYFVIKMPRKDFYIVGIVFTLNAYQMIQINTNIKISVAAADSFVYIGDLVLYMENDKIFIRNEANFETCKESFSFYLKDKHQNYIAPSDRHFALAERVKLRMWHTQVTYIHQYINGRLQTRSITDYILDYEL